MRSHAILFAVSLGLGIGPAGAADLAGNAALSLAARVGDRSPLTSLRAKGVLGAYLDSRPKARYLGHGKIEVQADAIDCSVGDVDITAKQCTLTFGKKTVSFHGKDAQALFATLIEAGVQTSGAAGSLHAAVRNLVCVIDPEEVRQKAGGGAKCTFSPGP